MYRGLENDWDSVAYYANDALENNTQSYLRDWLTTSGQSFDVFGANYSKTSIPANFLIQSTVSAGCRAWYYRYTMDLELLRKRVVYGDPHPTRTDITNDFVFINKAGGNTTYGCYGIFKFLEEFKRDAINANYGIAYVMYTSLVAEEAFFNMMEAYVMREEYDKVLELLNLYYSSRVVNYNAAAHEVTDSRILSKYSDNTISPGITPHFALTDKQEIYLKCIVNIRASEFVTEGQRWFDIKRMHLEINHNIFNGGSDILTANDPRRVISIPEDAAYFETNTDGFSTSQSTSGNYAPVSYSSIIEDNPGLTVENR